MLKVVIDPVLHTAVVQQPSFLFAVGDRVERLYEDRREVGVVTLRWWGGLSGENVYAVDLGPSERGESWWECFIARTDRPIGITWQQTTPDQFREFKHCQGYRGS